MMPTAHLTLISFPCFHLVSSSVSHSCMTARANRHRNAAYSHSSQVSVQTSTWVFVYRVRYASNMPILLKATCVPARTCYRRMLIWSWCHWSVPYRVPSLLWLLHARLPLFASLLRDSERGRYVSLVLSVSPSSAFAFFLPVLLPYAFSFCVWCYVSCYCRLARAPCTTEYWIEHSQTCPVTLHRICRKFWE